MSQLNDLKKHFAVPGARLTAFDALRKFGIARLAARIGELRDAGYVFDRPMVTVIGGSGAVKVTEYVLICTPAMARAAAVRASLPMAAV